MPTGSGSSPTLTSFSGCESLIELEIKWHGERQTIASYLKHPAVSNNKADNSVSSSSYWLGPAALHVFRNDCICSCSRSSDTQKHHLLPENVCPLSLSHRLRPGRHNIDSISIIITALLTTALDYQFGQVRHRGILTHSQSF